MATELLSSDMPGTEEFDGMSQEELGEALPVQGAPHAREDRQDDAGQRQGERAQGNQGAKSKVERAAAQGQLDPKPDDTPNELNLKIAALENTIQQMRRENRSTQALQSKVDRLENELKNRAAVASPPLSPEQQVLADQQAAAEKYLKQFLADNVPNILQDKYGHIVQAIERQEAERTQFALKSSIEKATGEMGVPFEEMDPIFKKLLTEDAQAAEDGDQVAKARIDRLFSTMDPSELVLRALRERTAANQAAGARVQQQAQKAADKGGRALKAGGAKPISEGKRSLADVEAMSDDERDKLSMEELEALVPKQRR